MNTTPDLAHSSAPQPAPTVFHFNIALPTDARGMELLEDLLQPAAMGRELRPDRSRAVFEPAPTPVDSSREQRGERVRKRRRCRAGVMYAPTDKPLPPTLVIVVLSLLSVAAGVVGTLKLQPLLREKAAVSARTERAAQAAAVAITSATPSAETGSQDAAAAAAVKFLSAKDAQTLLPLFREEPGLAQGLRSFLHRHQTPPWRDGALGAVRMLPGGTALVNVETATKSLLLCLREDAQRWLVDWSSLQQQVDGSLAHYLQQRPGGRHVLAVFAKRVHAYGGGRPSIVVQAGDRSFGHTVTFALPADTATAQQVAKQLAWGGVFPLEIEAEWLTDEQLMVHALPRLGWWQDAATGLPVRSLCLDVHSPAQNPVVDSSLAESQPRSELSTSTLKPF